MGIINTSDGSAIASKGELMMQGKWIWRLKDWIDRNWIAQYSTMLPVMRPDSSSSSTSLPHNGAMRCGGCGSKVGASILYKALNKIKAPTREEIVVGLDRPDDCALIKAPVGQTLLIETVDFFRAFCNDEYVFGQIAANHALRYF